MEKVVHDDIIKIFETVLENEDIDVRSLKTDVGLDEQGIDSLDRMNIIFQIQDDFQIEISEESLEEGEWMTIDKIVINLNKLLQEAAS